MSDSTESLSLFNIDYTLEDSEAILHAMCRDPTNPRRLKHIPIRGFTPYFYVYGDAVHSQANEIRRIFRDQRYLTSLVGEPVTKVETFIPQQVRDLRTNVFRHMQTYQSKVLFPNNFLATTGIKSGLSIPMFDGNTIPYSSISPNNSIYVEPLVTMLDIEVDNSQGGLPSWRRPTMPITMNTAVDTYTNKMYTFAWHPNRTHDDIKDDIYHYTYSNVDIPWKIFLFTEEYPMMVKIVEYLTKVRQDIITGWNVHFDMAYILARCQELKIDTSGISPIGKTYVNKYGDAFVGCVAILDMLECYKSLTKFTGLKDSYKLGDVGFDELKLSKMPHQGSVGQFWMQKFKKSIMYNVRDVEICWELNKKLKIMRYFDIQRRQVGCTYGDVMSTKRIIEMDQLRAAMSIGKVLPTYDKDDYLSGDDDDDDDIEGAYVFPPTIGVFDHVLAFDLKSLYPSIIQTLNISPETRIDKDLHTEEQLRQFIRSAAGHYYRKDITGFAKDRLIAFNKDRDKFKSCVLLISKIQKSVDKLNMTTITVQAMIDVARGVVDEYDSTKPTIDGKKKPKPLPTEVISMITQVIDSVSTTSYTVDSFKKMLDSEKTTYDLMQMAEKAKINTWYGVMGHEGAALYNPADAESVTLSGQEIIKFTASVATSPELKSAITEKFGVDIDISVLYGDTDSIMLKGFHDIKDGKLICKIADFIAAFINKQYDRFCQQSFNCDPGAHYLSIRCEKIARRFLMAPKKDSDEGGKKRYSYLPWYELKGDEEWVEYTKNDIVVVGFESKRSNVAKIGRVVQKKVLELILFEKPRAMIRAVVLDVAEKFKKKSVPLEYITFNVSLKELNEYKAVRDKKPRSSWPIHARAAQYGIEYLGQQWMPGDKVKVVYVSRCPAVYPPTEEVAIDGDNVPRGFDIDWNKIHEKQVKSPLDSILRAINWNYVDLETGSSQAKI